MKILLRLAIVVAGFLAVLILLALGFRAYQQHRNEARREIRTPNGIQEGAYVAIGGIPQWIQIRGEDRGNPVLLFVHGGPGASTIPVSSSWQPWEKYFTVVQWDQRGAGRTLRQAGRAVAPTMTIDRFVNDGIEVAEYLRRRLHASKILLVGHSWGSFIGYQMAMRRPDLFSAFVGTGQLLGGENAHYVFEMRYAKLRALAVANHDDRAVAALDAMTRPEGHPDFRQVIRWSKHLGVPLDEMGNHFLIPPPFMPDFSLVDWYYYLNGYAFSGPRIEPQLGGRSLTALGRQFPIPVFFFEGTADGLTPMAPAEKFAGELEAPHKEFVRFEGANHFLPFDRADEFLSALRQRVLPVIQAKH